MLDSKRASFLAEIFPGKEELLVLGGAFTSLTCQQVRQKPWAVSGHCPFPSFPPSRIFYFFLEEAPLFVQL